MSFISPSLLLALSISLLLLSSFSLAEKVHPLDVSNYGPHEPQQIHLSLTDREDEMRVMWLTNKDIKPAQVQFGLSKEKMDTTTNAYSTNKHYEFLINYRSGAIQTATMSGLEPGQTYYYRVGSPTQWSEVFSFRTGHRNYPLRILITGDVGSTDNSMKTIDGMLSLHEKSPVDFVMHSGDISYANGVQKWWDIWQNKVQPLAASAPYMVTVGNHEAISLFIPYLKRFAMPFDESGGVEGNMYYSFSYGPVHFTGLSSESVLFDHFLPQYQFLKSDLAKVDRKQTPWLFTSWHRPMYCASTAHVDSDHKMRLSYEDLLYANKVDISFTGHVHAAEITKRIYNGTIVDDGIITVVQGNGGNHEGLYKHWQNPLPAWANKMDGENYGFGLMTIYNSTTLHYENLNESLEVVYDEWVVTQH